jgi:hypothetical protein
MRLIACHRLTKRVFVRPNGMRFKAPLMCVLIATMSGLAANLIAQNSNRRFNDFTTGSRDGRRLQVSTSVDGNQPVTDCRQIRFEFDGDRTDAITGEEQVRIPRTQISELRFRASANAGVYVSGSSSSDYIVKTCKAVPGDDPLRASQTLGQIQTSESGGQISVTGPQGGQWSVAVIIEAPRDGALDLETLNGPVDLLDLTGRIQVRAVNGPVGIRGLSGDVKLSATNGPVMIELDGSRWNGRGLEASATNGPLTIRLPDSYTSGVRINVSGHTPIRCRAAQCNQAIRRLGSPDLIEIGGPDSPVHLSTVNGPLSIEAAR